MAEEERLIVDFGSGTTKFKLLRFTHLGNSEHSWKVVDEVSLPIPHQKCLEESKVEMELSKECIINGVVSVTAGLETIGADCNKIRCVGVATAWARLTKNLDEYFHLIQNDLKIQTIVLSQHQEGAIGYIASIPFLKEKCTGVDGKKCAVWDIGGGSFQQVLVRNVDLNGMDHAHLLAEKDMLHSNLGPWGSVNFAHSLYRHLGINDTSRILVGNEVERASEYANSLFVDLNTTSIAKHISSQEFEVHAIGEFMNKGFLPFISESRHFTIEWARILRSTFVIAEVLGEGVLCKMLKNSAVNFDCDNMRMIETNLILVIAIMEAIGLKSFYFLPEVSIAGAIESIDSLIESLYQDPATVG